MIKEAFGKGATTEAAIEAAKSELGAPWDADVQIEVLKTAKKKTLGLFGGSLAEVRAYYEVPDEVKKPEPKPAVKNQKPAKPEKKAEAKKPEVKKEAAPKKQEAVKETEKTVGDASKAAEAYIKAVLEGMGVKDAEVTSCEDDESVYVQLDCGNDYGYVIGRRGETLDAIQYLTRLVINKGKDNYKRVSINAGNYREKREVTLRELAKKNAARVKKYGRNVCLDPMNPYERRIIHSALQNDKFVATRSEGEEPFRHVIVYLKNDYRSGGRDNYKKDYGRN